MQKIKVEQHVFGGGVWFGIWMFCIGLLDLDLGQAIVGLVIWPYYLGRALTNWL